MAELDDLRSQIDSIDDELLELLGRRMKVADGIADYKREHDLPVLDKSRERAILADVYEKSDESVRDYSQLIFSLLFEASRARQSARIGRASTVGADIKAAMEATDALFPPQAYVACQGVEGAYSQIAADRLFKHPSITYLSSFDAVFTAVEQGFCRYGVLPIENSTAGSVNQVYDLMMRHNFHIVRTTRIKIDHNLLAKRGTKIDDIRDVYTHAQAIEQSRAFLDSLPNAQVHVCENTAMAAQMVAQSERTDIAALSSRSCADLYDLDILAKGVQDSGNNYTRFACIGKQLEIFPGADRTSLMVVVNHEPGSLCKLLERFYALEINLIKLESRPIPDRDFEFMFYFDLECPVAAPEFATLMSSLDDVCEEFRYLGSYSEVI